MEVKFLFWNIDGKDNRFISKIGELTSDINILLLAEASNIDDIELEKQLGLKKINYKGGTVEQEYTPKFYSRFTSNEFQHINTLSSSRGVFASLKIGSSDEIIIIGIHFPSKLRCSDSDQLRIAKQYVAEIENIENIYNHKRTLVFGDFNMNPFDRGMIEPDAFNATLSVLEAQRLTRKAHYNDFNYFYNPMWSFLGDRNCETGNLKLPGTYYYANRSSSDSIYWNVFDSVILRPQLVDIFDFSSIKIIDNLGSESLVEDNFIIKNDIYSDHLPLTFTINL